MKRIKEFLSSYNGYSHHDTSRTHWVAGEDGRLVLVWGPRP